MEVTPFIKLRMEKPFMDADGGDLGDGESPSIWLFGIEHGINKNLEINQQDIDNSYSIEIQRQFTYNRNAFKLLAAIDGWSTEADTKTNKISLKFAETKKPFIRGEKGYFKGNLFSYACTNVATWDADIAEAETGFKTKEEYYTKYRDLVFPEIFKKVLSHRPKLIIGVGTTFRNDFCLAFLNSLDVKLTEKSFEINKHKKNILYNTDNETKLVIIPHLSGGSNGLNGSEANFQIGLFIKDHILSCK